jgi:heme O synthase-like polyprenyltransferase
VGAAILSGAFLWMAVRGLTTEGVAWASRLFHFSLVYLGLVFTLAAVAAVLPH